MAAMIKTRILIVDDHAVDSIILVGCTQLGLQILAIDLVEIKVEATASISACANVSLSSSLLATGLCSPVSVHASCRILVCQIAV